jgi:hypothetical protein
MIFSHTSALARGFDTSSVSSASPAVFSLWLWHVTQNVSKTARGAGASVWAAAAGWVWRAEV